MSLPQILAVVLFLATGFQSSYAAEYIFQACAFHFKAGNTSTYDNTKPYKYSNAYDGGGKPPAYPSTHVGLG